MPARAAMISRVSRAGAILAAVLLFPAPPAVAKIVEEVVEIAVTAANLYGRQFTQPITLTVVRDDERERSPFLVLNHGRPATPADFAKMGRVRYTANARYFVSKGFAVFMPTRMGYGVSGGEDVEYSGACQSRQYPPAFEAAAQQTLKVIEHARSLKYVDPGRGLVMGQSYGGATAIAIAAKQVPGVLAAVNFAGGGGGNPAQSPEKPCRADLMEELLASYGATARIPTLWLYSENDRYWGKELPRRWFESFRKRGGAGDFVQLPPLQPPLGEDGHAIFTRNPDAWRPALEDFLRRTGFLQ